MPIQKLAVSATDSARFLIRLGIYLEKRERNEKMKLEEIFTMQNIIIYLIAINLITFFIMWLDKRKAKKGRWRIPENTLLLFVLLGGGVGGIVGMYVFHHKTQKAKFVIGFPVILICEILIVIATFVL